MGGSQSVNTPKNKFTNVAPNILVEYMIKKHLDIQITQLICSNHPYDNFLERSFNNSAKDPVTFKNMLIGYCGTSIAEFICNKCLEKDLISDHTLNHVLYTLTSMIEIVNSSHAGYIQLLNVIYECECATSQNSNAELVFMFIIENSFKVVSSQGDTWPANNQTNDKFIIAFINYLSQQQKQLSVLNTIELCLPRLSKLSTEAFSNIFCGYTYDPSKYLPTVDLTKSKLLSNCLYALLCCTLTDYYVSSMERSEVSFDSNSTNKIINSWTLLYSSKIHGNSINRFKGCCFDYFAPTIMLIAVEDGSQFCAGVDCCWRSESNNWGGPMCFFNQLLPKYEEIFSGEKMMYFNIKSRALPTGIRIGGPHYANSIFSIDADFSNCQFQHKTYNSNKISSIEVFGCNSDVALPKKQKFTKLHQQNIEKSKKVNTKVLWKDNVDRQLLEFGGLHVSHSEHLFEQK